MLGFYEGVHNYFILLHLHFVMQGTEKWQKERRCNTGSIGGKQKKQTDGQGGEKRNKINEWSGREGRVEERE